jgi:Protein of unknown function (DUF2023)
MNVFAHHIYEYQKGLRKLILHTLPEKNYHEAVTRLTRLGIPFHVQRSAGSRINVFFGSGECIDVVKSFGNRELNQLTPEEDFILGAMLGYGIQDQCARYIRFRNRKQSKEKEPGEFIA